MLLDDVETALVTAGVAGGATGWTIYKAFLPDTPDRAIAIFETPGEVPDQSRARFDFPYFQVRVRGGENEYDIARMKIQDVFDALHNGTLSDGNSSPPGTYIYCFAVQSGPLPMGHDGKRRPEMSWNFKTMRSGTQ